MQWNIWQRTLVGLFLCISLGISGSAMAGKKTRKAKARAKARQAQQHAMLGELLAPAHVALKKVDAYKSLALARATGALQNINRDLEAAEARHDAGLSNCLHEKKARIEAQQAPLEQYVLDIEKAAGSEASEMLVEGLIRLFATVQDIDRAYIASKRCIAFGGLPVSFDEKDFDETEMAFQAMEGESFKPHEPQRPEIAGPAE